MAVTAPARELAGFIWAVMVGRLESEGTPHHGEDVGTRVAMSGEPTSVVENPRLSYEAAASLASNGGAGLQGLRDAAIIRVMSDTLTRISEIAALRCSDASGGGTALIRAPKFDQQGEGSTRYVGPSTLVAVQRHLEASGRSAGTLFRQVRRAAITPAPCRWVPIASTR